MPADEQLRRPYFGLHRLEWPSDTSVNFYLGYGDWIRLLRANDFEVEDLIELQAPEGATTTFRRDGGVGASLAERGDLEGAQARLRRRIGRSGPGRVRCCGVG